MLLNKSVQSAAKSYARNRRFEDDVYDDLDEGSVTMVFRLAVAFICFIIFAIILLNAFA